MSTYLRVRWLHEHKSEPVLLFSELDEDRWQTRKVEVFHDNTQGFASKAETDGGSRLGELPMPILQEMTADPEFEPIVITASEFERAWDNRHGKFAD